jgi:predicted Zn-dependent protease
MAIRFLTIIFLACAILSCNLIEGEKEKKPSKEMTYSYTCLDSAVSGSRWSKTLGKAGDIISDIAVNEKSITDDVQSQWGAAFHKDAVENKTFNLMKDARIQAQLDKVMQDLLQAREQASNIQYAIYAIEDTAVNAFTFGGRIYVTRAMLKKCEGKTPLLYSIIGHEIGHSEKGHIKKAIQQMEVSNKIFGEQGGALFLQVQKLLTGSFNQKNELEADYYGTDLSYRLDQDICSAVEFWKEMASKENSYNKVEDFFRTHPFSSLRAECLQTHIRTNFNRSCGSIKKEATLPQVQ